MSHFNDDYDSGPDESEEAEPIIRELRAEILRLEAQLDQFSASVRERAAETALIQVQLAELTERVARLEARRRRDVKLIVAAWVLMLISMALSLYTYFTI
jgi:septal ring factor EnvC (AmiA/AmiB activator)